MKKKGLIIGGIVVGIIVIIALVFLVKTIISNSKSINIKLDKDNYLTSVGVDSKAKFILVINKKEKISNVLFLNKESVDFLANKKIEGKDFASASKIIVDSLKNNNDFEKDVDFNLVDYGNSSIYQNVKEELNKELVIYGVDKEIVDKNDTLSSKILELNLEDKGTDITNLEELYNYSIKMLGGSNE